MARFRLPPEWGITKSRNVNYLVLPIISKNIDFLAVADETDGQDRTEINMVGLYHFSPRRLATSSAGMVTLFRREFLILAITSGFTSSPTSGSPMRSSSPMSTASIMKAFSSSRLNSCTFVFTFIFRVLEYSNII